LSSRRTARKNAFLVLYQTDVTDRSLDEALKRWREHRENALDPYSVRLIQGVNERRRDLDDLIGASAVGWPVRRMSAVDRAILRLALYEMLHVEDVPAEVAISEAMELAKGYSSEEAPRFVGGVLRGARDRWMEGESGGAGEAAGDQEESRVGHG